MPSDNPERRDDPVSTSVEAQAVRVLSRHTATIPSFDGRWLIGIVVSVPVLVGAGVYWLHQQPSGKASRSDGPIVEVRLMRDAPVPAPVVALRPTQELTSLQTDNLLDAPERPIPEETAPVTPAPGDQSPTPSASQPPSTSAPSAAVPSGTATAFQRMLVRHIARYLRYPDGVRPSQMSGVVQVMFAMRRDGTVTETWVRSSSGHWVLDQAATETIRRAQPLPTIPPDLPDTLTVLLPVSFDAR